MTIACRSCCRGEIDVCVFSRAISKLVDSRGSDLSDAVPGHFERFLASYAEPKGQLFGVRTEPVKGSIEVNIAPHFLTVIDGGCKGEWADAHKGGCICRDIAQQPCAFIQGLA